MRNFLLTNSRVVSRAAARWARRLPVLALLLLLPGAGAWAQAASTYGFAASAGAALAPMVGATQLIGAAVDDDASANTAIGFSFVFEGVAYTTFSVTPDGFVKLGAVTSSQFSNALSSSTNIPKLAAHWDDLATGTTGEVRYLLSGTAPNKRLVMEWFVTAPRNTGGPADSRFQIWLDQTTNAVSFVYGAVGASSSYSVGLRGTGATTNLLSVNTTTNLATAGTANDSQSAAMAAGKRYTFTPPVVTCPAPNTLSVSNLAPTSATLNWASTAPATGSGTFTVEYGPAGFAPGAGTAVPNLAGPSYALTGLTANTAYDFYVTQNCTAGNGNSTRTGPQAFSTPVVPPAFAVTRGTGAAYASIAATGSSFTFGSTNTDDNTSATVPLTGFPFSYLGTAVTGFKVCTNGWLTFNTAQTASTFSNSLGGGGLTQLLAPFWEDLVCQGNPTTAAALAASMKYQLAGSPGSQVLTVEWIGMETFLNAGPNLNFQVKLFEGSNVIRYVYGNMSGFDGSADYTYAYSVGLTAAANVATGSYLAQQTPNTDYFLNANAGTANTLANGLSVVPACFSQVQFSPAAAFSAGASPPAPVPANDEPATALALPVGTAPPTDFCAVYTSAGATASAGVAACAAGTPGIPDDDVWFRFTLPTAGNTTLALRSSGGYDGVLQLFAGAPGSLTAVACQNATGNGLTEGYANASLPAGTYYVRVYAADNGAGTNGTFVLSAFATPPIPANDECAGAVVLTSAGACTLTAGTTLGATASAGVAACVGTPDDDVWFRFVATATAHAVTVQGAAGFDAVVQAFSGSCAALTSIACVNNTSTAGGETATLTGLTVGNPYYVQVYHSGSGTGSGSFGVCLTAPCDAPTALAATAVAASGASLSWTAGAGGATFAVEYGPTGFVPGTGTTVSPATSPQAVSGLAPATVYQFYVVQTCGPGATATAGPAAFTTLAACAPATALAVGSITPTTASLSFVAGSGNTSYTVTYAPTAGGTATTVTPAPTASPVALTGLMPGTAYTVSVLGLCSAGSTTTPATTTFTSAFPVPANDQPAGAVLIGCNAAVAGTTLGATTAGDPATACGVSSSTSPGVFYRFVGTGDVVEFNTCTGSGFDTQLQVFTSAFACVAGNDDACGLQSRVSFTSLPGTAYFVFVNGFGSNTGNFTLTSVCTTVPDLVVSAPQTVSGTYNNVTVQSGGVATLTGPLTVNGTLTVQSGGVLIQNCQIITGPGNFALLTGGTLHICDALGITPSGATGAVQVTGTRAYAADASYVYNGTAAQVTGPGLPPTVRNVTANNAAGLNLSQPLALTQVARLTLGDLATHGFAFTLLSSAAGTALIDNTGGVVVGPGTMQRAVTNAVTGPAYRHFSSPVAATTLADLATPGFAPTFTPAYNSAAAPNLVTPFPTVFGYDQARLATVASTYGAFDKGWFSPTGPGDAMLPTRGYTVNAPATAVPIDFVGTFNNAAQNSGALGRGTDPQAGWQLLGNPYPSPLDWNTVAAAQRPGMDAAMYVYQSTGQYAGTYRSFANGVGLSPLIDAGSGYFARVTTPGGTGAVNLTNANRLTAFGPEPAFGRGPADPRPQLRLTLTGAGLADDAFVYFEAGALAGVDAQYDAAKLANPAGLDLTSLSGAAPLAINGLPPLGRADVVVPLLVRAPQAGSFGFEVADLAHFGAATVWLHDALAGTQQLLAAGSRYPFALATATAGTGRFALVFRPAAVTGTRPELSAASVSLYPNPARHRFTLLLPPLPGQAAVRATLLNALGQVLHTRTLPLTAAGATAEFDTRALAAGVYLLQLRTENQLLTKRVVVE